MSEEKPIPPRIAVDGVTVITNGEPTFDVRGPLQSLRVSNSTFVANGGSFVKIGGESAKSESQHVASSSRQAHPHGALLQWVADNAGKVVLGVVIAVLAAGIIAFLGLG